MSDTQQDYTDALAGYREALARLQEAKRHIPESPRARYQRRRREARAAERALWVERAAARAADPEASPGLLTVEMITAKALSILHQKVNAIADAETKVGQSLRIHLPISYRTGDDNE